MTLSHIHHKRFKPYIINISPLASMIRLMLSEILKTLVLPTNIAACAQAQWRLANRIKNVSPCARSDGILRIKCSINDFYTVSEANGRGRKQSAKNMALPMAWNATLRSVQIIKKSSPPAAGTRSHCTQPGGRTVCVTQLHLKLSQKHVYRSNRNTLRSQCKMRGLSGEHG